MPAVDVDRVPRMPGGQVIMQCRVEEPDLLVLGARASAHHEPVEFDERVANTADPGRAAELLARQSQQRQGEDRPGSCPGENRQDRPVLVLPGLGVIGTNRREGAVVD